MNKILLLLLFILSVKGDVLEGTPYYKECPSVNVGRGDGIVNCPSNYNYYCKPLLEDIDDLENIDDFYKFYATENDNLSGEDCYSQHLYNRKVGNEAMYYNKCCLLKFQYQGNEYYHCVGLTDDQMMDVPVTIKELEDEFGERTGNDMYIKSLNCKGEYIFYSMIGTLLLALIF